MNFNAADSMAEFLDPGPNPTINQVIGGYQEVPLSFCKGFCEEGEESTGAIGYSGWMW